MVVFMKRRQLAAAALGVLAALTLLFVIPGCQRDSGGTEPVQAADNAARVAYLESLGWQVTPEPLETLSLLLPEDLSAHAEYAALQKDLGLPFDRCGGKTVTRYTYTVLNYPDAPQGVQANLFVCGDQVIAGDITSLGENSFRRNLEFPQGQSLPGGAAVAPSGELCYTRRSSHGHHAICHGLRRGAGPPIPACR